jgi:hypothetical protein
MLSNSIMAQEGVEHIGTANQLVRLFLATELRVWGGREVRGGNGTLRAVANAARLATNAHSVVLLTWLASIGAAHVGDRIARHDEETDADAAAARLLDEIRPRNPARGGGVGVDGGGRGWNGKMEKVVKSARRGAAGRRGSAGLAGSVRGAEHDDGDATGGSHPGRDILLREIPSVQGGVTHTPGRYFD